MTDGKTGGDPAQDIEGKAMTLRPAAHPVGNGRWEAELTAWWDQGENTYERTMLLEGEFPSEDAALQHAAHEARPLAAMTEVPPAWLA
ncbi:MULTISPECIES: hypothetical protein [unclassified Rhizobacter]|uniref:hypothetical protein n=1 Tax=unclassified Rhizobacter TaxID=2640088 RepID=UPI0006FBA118|nr:MULTISPECIES: hypothetical protein [unclassified Rhizobacter]KQV97847.1 hypothetical protein ASC98_11100 [Rhizobacter sp. Root1238]